MLSLPTNRAIIVQRTVHCQTRKFSVSSEINAAKSVRPEEAKVSNDNGSPKRVDSLWKVGAQVSAAGGIENTVTNAVSIGSVNAHWQIGLVIVNLLTRLPPLLGQTLSESFSDCLCDGNHLL